MLSSLIKKIYAKKKINVSLSTPASKTRYPKNSVGKKIKN
jgi:hypothetical protein